MHQLTITILAHDEEPDRSALGDLIRQVADHIEGTSRSWGPGTVQTPGLQGTWAVEAYTHGEPGLDTSAIALKADFIRRALGDEPFDPDKPDGILLSRQDVRSIFRHGMDTGPAMPAVSAPHALNFAEVKALATSDGDYADALATLGHEADEEGRRRLPLSGPDGALNMSIPVETDLIASCDAQTPLAVADAIVRTTMAAMGADYDSLIREAMFTRAAARFGLDYELLYQSWLSGRWAEEAQSSQDPRA